MTKQITITALALALGLAAPQAQAQALDKINVSAIKAATFGGLFIAKERGYFANEVFDVNFAYFDASPPIAVATVSGNLDFGMGQPLPASSISPTSCGSSAALPGKPRASRA